MTETQAKGHDKSGKLQATRGYEMAADAGLGRESLYKALVPGAKPRYDTVLKLARAAGMRLRVEPIHASSAANAVVRVGEV